MMRFPESFWFELKFGQGRWLFTQLGWQPAHLNRSRREAAASAGVDAQAGMLCMP